MIICVDVDYCLANFTEAYADLLIQVDGKDRLPEGWRTSPDFPQTWYWERDAGYSKEVEEAAWQQRILHKGSHFWEQLAPVPGAKEVIRHLNKLAIQGHSVYFLTHRMGDKAKLQTEKWLYGLQFYYPTVLLSADKVPLLRALGANFFIDDKPQTVIDVAKAAEREKWQDFQLFMHTAPYNKHLQGLDWLKTAGSVEEALQKAGLWKER